VVRRLLIRPGAIGDFLVSLPALECLRADYTEVWSAAPNVSLARFADRARAIRATGLDLLEISGPSSQLLETLRAFDSIVSWYGTNRPEFRQQVRALGLDVQFLDALPPHAAGQHACDFYLDQARRIGRCTSDGVPRLGCSRRPAGFVVIHPFSGSVRKNWPLPCFQALARELERSIRVRWCAGPDDPPLDGAVRISDLWELANWLATAEAFVGNDCGISHLAAAAGVPVLALFGPTDPGVWGPRGPEVQIVRFGAAV
jgi:hypothetical protein